VSSNVAKGKDLEDSIESILAALMDKGDVVDEYHLLRARDYPDFWARDKMNREWLIEAKNSIPGFVKNPKHFQENGRWTEEYLWTERHILSKTWRLPTYETRPAPGDKHGTWITVHAPNPLLVIRHMNFDLPSLRALRDLFGDRGIICFGDKDPATPRYEFLITQMRALFTNPPYVPPQPQPKPPEPTQTEKAMERMGYKT
jgi:hypothetical protein